MESHVGGILLVIQYKLYKEYIWLVVIPKLLFNSGVHYCNRIKKIYEKYIEHTILVLLFSLLNLH